jgi:uncharacterized protein YpiB (UPF0302 family)
LNPFLCAGHQAAVFTGGPQNGATLHKCTGDNVTLPWSYKLPSGNRLNTIQWFLQGRLRKMVAVFILDRFMPATAFAKRVHFLPNAGLQITNVTCSDNGNYSVEIQVADASDSTFNLRRTATLKVEGEQILISLIHRFRPPRSNHKY